MRHFTNAMLLIAASACVVVPRSVAAQLPVGAPQPAVAVHSLATGLLDANDTVTAVARAKEAAREDASIAFLFGGIVAMPFTVATALYLGNSSQIRPWMAGGPVGMVALIAGASGERPLPAQFQRDLEGADSTYSAVYRRTYSRTVNDRRLASLTAGSVIGISIAYLLLRGLIND